MTAVGRFASVALATALIGAACGSVAGGPVAAPTRSVVPYADLHWTPPPLSTPTPPPTDVRLCRAHDLSVTDRGYQGATGWIVQSFGLRNRSGTPCLLRGAPGVRLVRGDGRVYAEVAPKVDSGSPGGKDPGWAVLTPQTLDAPRDQNLPAGQAAVGFLTYGSCEHPVLSRYEFILDGDPNPLVFPIDPPAPFGGGRCDEPGQQLTLSAEAVWHASTPVPPTPTPSPLPLTVTLEAPRTVRAGSVLTFVVTLTNTSASPLLFDDCPVYRAWIANNAPPVMVADAERQKPGLPPPMRPSYLPLAALEKNGLLNCRPAGPLASGESAAFAIEIALRSDAPLGSSTLGFELASQVWLLKKDATFAGIEVIP